MKTEVTLNDAFKTFTIDQDKILPPDETVMQFKSKLKKLNLNLLEQTVRIDNGRLDIPIYFSICGSDAASVIGTKKQMGKGATPAQSEASAVMELAERFSFFSFTKNPQNFFLEKYCNIDEKAIPFDMIAQSVHDDSQDLDISKKIFEGIPLKWTKAYNLTQKKELLIPFNWFFMINEFNGPSAGNCVEEAIIQGICEIVERHVSSIISHRELRVPGILPDSATDPKVVEMIGKYRQNGIQLFVSDFTLEMGIPSVGVLACDPSTFPQRSEIVWTAGTTPDPQKAFSRALTEVAQLAGDFNSSSNYVASGLPKFLGIEEAEYITHPDTKIQIQDLPDISDENMKIEIENALAALAGKGMELLLVNTMHHLLAIPAFYAIIPGAHFRERALGTSVAMFASKIIADSQPPAKAVSELEKINTMLPGKYYVHFYLGSCHLALNDPQTAANCFNRALDLDPTSQDIPSIYSYLGVCLKDMGEYRNALDVLTEGQKLDPERTDIYNLMGFCHFKLKDHQAAIDNFKKVLQLDPTSAIDYANIASNYRDMGKKEHAIRYYEMALELDSSIDFAQQNLKMLKDTT